MSIERKIEHIIETKQTKDEQVSAFQVGSYNINLWDLWFWCNDVM
jgi:hypothetical protein